MKHKKNGFTLVELIVVLVILAVLAALLVPALTGYIDKARKSQVIAETRSSRRPLKRNYLLYTQQTNSLSKISMLYLLLLPRTISLISLTLLSEN